MMKKALTFILYVLLTIFSAIAQTTISGSVIDTGGSPLTGVSVILRNSEGKIKKYASTNTKGEFSISVPETENCTIDVSMIGFGKKSVSLDDASYPLTIQLEHEALQLKEVAVKAERIREQGDTITYNVGTFAQAQDRSIGDVLKRMPGIDVAKSGKIQYQGTDINKFYIEGSDLLGGKYGLATNGINHEDVGAVEVMENHQPMQVLSGISFSDKAAINLRLKKKAKATWSLHGKVGGGYSWQPEEISWDGEAFAMAVMPSFQNIATFKTNNTGDDLTAHVSDFFSGGRQTDLKPYVGLTLPDVTSLDRRRTLFNRSFLFSANNLWKLKNGEFKSQIDYAFNRISARSANITAYFLTDGERIISEQRNATDHTHSLSGKFIYEQNQKTAFLNNTLQTDIDWNSISLGVTGSLPNHQSASIPDYYVRNTFKMIKRIRGKHLITFESDNEWESLPQTLHIGIDGNMHHQHIGDHAFYTNESAAYAFSIKGITISLEGGLKAYMRSMDSYLSETSSISTQFENVVNTNYVTIHATPKLEYWIRRINIKLTVPVSVASYSFDKSIADRSEAYIAPSINFNWKPNNRFTINLHGGTGRSPMNLNLIHPGLIMTDYRSFRRGIDTFCNSSSQSVSGSLQYKHTRRGVFANAMVMQSWRHMPYTMVQQLYGDYIVYSYAPAKSSGKQFMINGNIGKTINFMQGSANLRGSFNRNESTVISENSVIASVSTSWNAGIRINGTPISWFSFDISSDFSESRLAMNSDKAPWLGCLHNSLLINIMPHRKWEYHISGDYYRNEIMTDRFKNVLILDSKLAFKPNKHIELSGVINNICNRRTYNYTVYNQLSSFESQRWIRGRELLITISLRK